MVSITSIDDQSIRMDQLYITESYLGQITQYNRSVIEYDMSSTLSLDNNIRILNRIVGIDLKFDALSRETTGTITGFQHIVNGNPDFIINNLLIDASTMPHGSLNIGGSSDNVILSSDDTIEGSSKADRIIGYDGNDTISGSGGDDDISSDLVGFVPPGFKGASGTGNDVVYGGSGADDIKGGGGNDHLYGFGPFAGDDGDDHISGGEGSDYLQGNSGEDALIGGDGSDRIQGGSGNDNIYGDGEQNTLGNDTINGNKGNDIIDGGGGQDMLRGGQGDDSIVGGAGDDVLFGDLGSDTLCGTTQSGAFSIPDHDYLTGGLGADLFLFIKPSYPTNSIFVDATYITDFEDSIDKIKMSDFAPQQLVWIGDVENDSEFRSITDDFNRHHVGGATNINVYVGTHDGKALIYHPGYELVMLDNFDANKLTLDDFIV